MITEFEVEYKTESGHSYGTYTCPKCGEKVKSRVNLSYLAQLTGCKKCAHNMKLEKYKSENRFMNGKEFPKKCVDCDIELDDENRSKTIDSYCVCVECQLKRRKKYRNKESTKLKNKNYNLKRRETKWNHVLFSLIKRRYPQTDLSPEYIKELWDKQNGLCFWFKIPMTITRKSKYPSKPSVDRLDNSKPYTKDNCVLCCYSANIGRNINNVEAWMVFVNTIKEQVIKEHEDKQNFANNNGLEVV